MSSVLGFCVQKPLTLLVHKILFIPPLGHRCSCYFLFPSLSFPLLLWIITITSKMCRTMTHPKSKIKYATFLDFPISYPLPCHLAASFHCETFWNSYLYLPLLPLLSLFLKFTQIMFSFLLFHQNYSHDVINAKFGSTLSTKCSISSPYLI